MIKAADIMKYIGIEYINKGRSMMGCDCFGLVQNFYKLEFNIDLPEHFYYKSNDKDSAEEALSSGRCDWKKVEIPEQGDVILLNIGGRTVHMGIVIDKRRMLHSLLGHNSGIELFDGERWKNRIEGFYRWAN